MACYTDTSSSMSPFTLTAIRTRRAGPTEGSSRCVPVILVIRSIHHPKRYTDCSAVLPPSRGVTLRVGPALAWPEGK